MLAVAGLRPASLRHDATRTELLPAADVPASI
jgi:hypothetical protein